MPAAPGGPGDPELGPPDRDDPHWPVGDRRDGWLKVGDDTFVRGNRLEWLAIRAGLHAVRFAHLGRRPVLGPAHPVHRGATPSERRHDVHWEPVAGPRGRLLRCVPPAALGLAAVSAVSAARLARHLRRTRVHPGRPGRLTA